MKELPKKSLAPNEARLAGVHSLAMTQSEAPIPDLS
jgi:hypothetical protein